MWQGLCFLLIVNRLRQKEFWKVWQYDERRKECRPMIHATCIVSDWGQTKQNERGK